jgi:type II secretory pathway pseudopilin PulG
MKNLQKSVDTFKIKKGAMFGLDARIALAIFGALSVISGAALYSAITASKVTQRITQVSEIEKAISQYYLDTGHLPGFSSNGPTIDLDITVLVEDDGSKGWAGPYLNWEKHATNSYILDPVAQKSVAIAYKRNSDWTSSSTCLQSSASCNLYIAYLSETNLKNELEEALDGSPADFFNGKFRGSSHQFIKTDISFDPKDSPNT